jgi:hypothetical protein
MLVIARGTLDAAHRERVLDYIEMGEGRRGVFGARETLCRSSKVLLKLAFQRPPGA